MPTTIREVAANGMTFRSRFAGQSGEPVILLHGFPETSHMWVDLLPKLEAAGYRCMAPDQRGYSPGARPEGKEHYTYRDLASDVFGLADAWGVERFHLVGHDWGAGAGWAAVALQPGRIASWSALSVPHVAAFGAAIREDADQAQRSQYITFFQEPGVAEAELEADVTTTIRKLYFTASGDVVPTAEMAAPRPKTGKFLDTMVDPETLPGWLGQADLDFFVGEFKRTGFWGGLNWYRNLDRTWELMGAWRNAKVTVPALFITGEKDPVRGFASEANIRAAVPNLKDLVLVPGAGHWVQQERPAEVNAALLKFLRSL